MKVRQDQRVDLQVQKRLGEKWTRQPGPPAGPWSGSGNRLGAVSPYPDSTSSAASAIPAAATTMPGSFHSASTSSSSSSQPAARGGAAAAPISTNVQFEVDTTRPTTRLQIRLRDGEKVVATFNQSHTVGDIRRYINASVFFFSFFSSLSLSLLFLSSFSSFFFPLIFSGSSFSPVPFNGSRNELSLFSLNSFFLSRTHTVRDPENRQVVTLSKRRFHRKISTTIPSR